MHGCGRDAAKQGTEMNDKPVMVVNAHSDYPMAVVRQRRGFRQRILETDYLATQRKAGIRMEVMTVATDHRFPIHGGYLDMRHPRTVLEMIDAMHLELAESPDLYGLVLHGDDIDKIMDAGKIALMLNFEGVGCIEDDFSLWRTYYRLGVRSLSLTHDPQNQMASGCREPDGGLTRLGRQFVRELNKYNVALDLVHAGERTFFDALDHYDGMVTVSHSNARALCETPRNLTDAQIKAIGARGGFVAIVFCGAFLRANGREATVEDIVRHVDHIAGLIGIEHVAMGPDYTDYIHDFLPGLIEALGMEPSVLSVPPGLETVGGIQLVAEALSKHGYSDNEVRLVMGENATRTYRTILSRHPAETVNSAIGARAA
jgi:membrane dipeptidase